MQRYTMTRNILPVVIALAFACLWGGQAAAALYGVARRPAPVLNSPDFKGVFGGATGATLKTDRCGQVGELEFIALPGTVFRVVETISGKKGVTYRVETDDYPTPPGRRLYLDSRFLETGNEPPVAERRELPPRENILAAMRAAIGAPYVWGGNIRSGVPELATLLYRGAVGSRRLLAGVDCSGLLYQATNGRTPRNTAQLLSFGSGLPIQGKSAEEIVRQLEPLDLIVWNGHVIIVLDRDTAIESCLDCTAPGYGGVKTTPLQQRLDKIMQQRRPVDHWPTTGKQRDIFVVRRWMGQ